MNQLNSSYASPERRIIVNANVQAFRAPLVAPPPLGFNGGLILGNSASDQRLRHSRYWESVDHFESNLSFSETLRMSYTYCGPVFNHFGHMMSEMVHRVIPSLHFFQAVRPLFVGQLDDHQLDSQDNLPKFLKQLLAFWDIPIAGVVVVTQDTVVRNLKVCEQGSDFGGGPKDGYLRYLNDFTARRLNAIFPRAWAPLRVYASRADVRHGGIFLGESYIENLLEDEGFFIFQPERASIVHQMQVYKSSEVLIFPEGSACHGVELLGENSIETCCIIERRPDHREIFRRVLEPRSRRFYRFDMTISVGTAVLDPTSRNPLPNLGVSVVNMSAFIDFCRHHGLANLRNFDSDSYYNRAEADLTRYLEYHQTSGFLQAPAAALKAMWDTLADIRNSI